MSVKGSAGVADGRSGKRDGKSAKPTLVLQKALDVLDAFTLAAPELNLSEIRAAVGLPATTCGRLVQNLADEGLLERVQDRYRVSLGVLRWSAVALRGLDLVDRMTPVIERLRDRTGESAAVFVPQALNRTCVAVAPTRHSVIWQLQVGMSTPLHVGSGGRAILAFDPDAIEVTLAGARTALTDHTLVDAGRLCDVLAATRETGLAISNQELDVGVAGVSAPVFAPGSRVVASIGVAGPVQRFTEADIADYCPAVLDAARVATQQMGGEFLW
ncbi:MAG TPA: IclR family transcriptional regulator [Mycobacterium sp.]|nr:IclR family transcriptional regulator [Mycobacterium sp.]